MNVRRNHLVAIIQYLFKNKIIFLPVVFVIFSISIPGCDAGIKSGDVVIKDDETSIVDILAAPFEDYGTLDIKATWNRSLEGNVNIIAKLTRGAAVIPLGFTINGSSAAFNGEIPAGYYDLSILIQSDNINRGCITDSVRIEEGAATSFDVSIIADLYGSVDISVTSEMDVPVDVVINGTKSFIIEENMITFSVSAANYTISSNALIIWHLDGVLLQQLTRDEGGLIYSFRGDILVGNHCLDVSIFSEDCKRAGSAKYIFEVLETE